MSMVYDHYEDRIPQVQPWQVTYPMPTPFDDSITDLKKMLEDFRAAREAAAVVDEKTGQTECVDPEKQKLEARVAELEKLLANPPEFVIVQGGHVEPGTYRVIDGKLYRAV
jgi:hypothetical protein